MSNVSLFVVMCPSTGKPSKAPRVFFSAADTLSNHINISQKAFFNVLAGFPKLVCQKLNETQKSHKRT